MSAAMDRALMALSLEEDEEPLIIPNLPIYNSTANNALSIVGRVLNPECQTMTSLILQLPRKWGKEGRVRGVALSQEKFQFFFNHEYDLVEVLGKGVQTHHEWVVVLERWVENPPEDFLQFISVWVQISKLPMNYYTLETINRLAETLGFVEEVAFDATKPQTQDFVRVKIRYNVAKPLKMVRKITLPNGEPSLIHFHYERIQKRCFSCQSLNHEKDFCPLLVKKRQDEAILRRQKSAVVKAKIPEILKEGDPLYGVLQEEQVKIDSNTGRPKIAKAVLDEMRNYLLASNGEDKAIREERVRRSVKETEKDPIAQRIALRLEPLPIVTTCLDKEQGLVFDYAVDGTQTSVSTMRKDKAVQQVIELASGKILSWEPLDLNAPAVSEDNIIIGTSMVNSRSSTGFSIGTSEPCYSGTSKKKPYQRKRPFKAKRKPRIGLSQVVEDVKMAEKQKGKQEAGTRKRKGVIQEEEELQIMSQSKCLKVVPVEGLPKA